MSMHRHTYVMTGVRKKKEELPFDPDDEAYLPYLEGHEGVPVAIHPDPDGDYCYCGIVVVEVGPYTDNLSQILEFPSHVEVADLLRKHLDLGVYGRDVNNWIFDMWL